MIEQEHSLELQQIHAFDVERLPSARNRDNYCEADSRFRCCDDDHEENKNLALQLSKRAAERDEREIHSVEHEFDGHKYCDDVAAENKSHDAETKEHGAQDDEIGDRNHG